MKSFDQRLKEALQQLLEDTSETEPGALHNITKGPRKGATQRPSRVSGKKTTDTKKGKTKK